MNVERLTILKDYLLSFPKEQLEKGKFNLQSWMVANDYARRAHINLKDIIPKNTDEPFKIVEDILYGEKLVEPNFCQTVGCAMGWATTIPEFKELGLKLIVRNGNSISALPFYRDYTGFSAIVHFFDFDDNMTADYLFLSHHYVREEWTSPLAVSKRIDRLLNLGEAEFNKTFHD